MPPSAKPGCATAPNRRCGSTPGPTPWLLPGTTGRAACRGWGLNAAEDRIWTVPNLLSALRLLGVPVFLWLVLGPHADGWAIALLALAGFSDWLDGKLARAWNQISRLGRLIDPLADRLYILATLIGLV